MAGLSVHGDHFRRGGAPEFLLADTAWAAVPRSTAAEWAAYLRHRRRQGFTAVLISILPIPHGRSIGEADRDPFAAGPGRLDPEYLAVARERVAAVAGAGLTPLCVLVWNNYVPGTWGAARTPGTAMTAGDTVRHVDAVLHALRGLDPVWLVSGDEDFAGDEALARYETVLSRVRAAAPGALAGAHPAVDALPPAAFSARLDFHGYQSGHDPDHLPRCADLATSLRRRHHRAPILNLEPCYEDHLAAGTPHRHTAADVRRAAWTSVLAGATAGIGYGAHGVWSWHRDGDAFTDPGYAGAPAAFGEALRLDGARDMAFLRRTVEAYHLFGVAPRPEISVSAAVPVAATEDLSTVAAYVPAGTALRISGAAPGLRLTTMHLGERRAGAAGPAAAGPGAAGPAAAQDRLVLLHR